MPKWSRPNNPPPGQLFTGKPERDFVKQITDETNEYIIGQTVLYFAVDIERTNFHPLYKEAIEKIYYPPVRVNAFVDFEDDSTETTKYGIDRKSNIIVHFHNRRLKEDQNLYAKEGDLLYYGDTYYEIARLAEPEELFGQNLHRVGIDAYCFKSRTAPNFSNK